MQIPQSCDVVVIGGGPVGSTAATILAQKGFQVTLFDKQKHPRYAVGESLIPDFWAYTDLTGVTPNIEAEGFVQKAGGIMNWAGQHRTHNFVDFGYSRPALHVERDRFDHILLTYAKAEGVQVYEAVSVLKARFRDQDNDGMQAQITYRPLYENGQSRQINCRYVIDASGQNAVIGRQLGLRRIDEAFRYLSLWGYFEPGRYLDQDGKAQPHENLRKIPPTTYVTDLAEFGDEGWAWYIVLRDKVSVGLVFPLEATRSLKEKEQPWEDYFQQKCQQISVISQLLVEASLCKGSVRLIRDYSYRSTRVAGPGFFLIGDAAGFIDPIFSVGVPLGLYMANVAAWAIESIFKNPQKTAIYQALFTKQIEGRLEVARSMALPHYQTETQVSQLAKDAIRLERRGVQAMMHTATSLIDRTNNFKSMMADEAIAEMHPHKLRLIHQLVL